MPHRSDVVLLYDGSFDGFLSAVFVSYLHRPAPLSIEPQDGVQQQFEITYLSVETDDEQAQRTADGIRRTMGQDAYETVWKAFLSESVGSSAALYRYIRFGMRIGRTVVHSLTTACVAEVNALALRLTNEVGHLIQFVRFSRLDGGIYYAAIDPKGFVLPLLMPHFAARYQIQPFLLHDRTHQTVGVFDTHEWVLADASSLRLPDFAAEETAWRRLWKAFYESIAIRERQNLRLQMQHVPLRYRSCMIEMLPNYAQDFALHGPAGDPSCEIGAAAAEHVQKMSKL